MGKKAEGLDRRRRRAAFAEGVKKTYGETNLRYSQVSPIDMFEETNTGTNLPAQIDLYAVEGGEYNFMFAKGEGPRTRPSCINKPRRC